MEKLFTDGRLVKTWDDLKRAALYDPVLHAAVTKVSRGDCTREEALIAVALYFSDAVAQSHAREVERLSNAVDHQ